VNNGSVRHVEDKLVVVRHTGPAFDAVTTSVGRLEWYWLDSNEMPSPISGGRP
jgi:hypothetical protein